MKTSDEIEDISQTVMDRLAEATADVANAIMEYPDDYLNDYGDDFARQAKELMRGGCRDKSGSLADMVYNEDNFLEMARDWIWDETGDDADFDAVCESMAGKWAQKAGLFRSWRHG
jgi:hypothetical protein